MKWKIENNIMTISSDSTINIIEEDVIDCIKICLEEYSITIKQFVNDWKSVCINDFLSSLAKSIIISSDCNIIAESLGKILG